MLKSFRRLFVISFVYHGRLIFSHIITVNGGEIEEFGPQDELMAKKGFSYNLYMSQFKDKLPGSAAVDMSQFVST